MSGNGKPSTRRNHNRHGDLHAKQLEKFLHDRGKRRDEADAKRLRHQCGDGAVRTAGTRLRAIRADELDELRANRREATAEERAVHQRLDDVAGEQIKQSRAHRRRSEQRQRVLQARLVVLRIVRIHVDAPGS